VGKARVPPAVLQNKEKKPWPDYGGNVALYVAELGLEKL